MIISFSIIVQPDHEHQNVITIENLLYSFISHLGSSKTLQWHNGRVGPIAQQQFAGLYVTSQSSPVQSSLS